MDSASQKRAMKEHCALVLLSKLLLSGLGEKNTADLQSFALRETNTFPISFFISYNRTSFTLNLHRSGSGIIHLYLLSWPYFQVQITVP